MNSPLNKARYTLLLNPKQQHIPKIRAGKRKAAKENKTTGGGGGTTTVATTTARGVYHELAVVPSSQRGFVASRTLCFVLLFHSRVLAWIFRLWPIGPLLKPLLTWFGLNFMLLS